MEPYKARALCKDVGKCGGMDVACGHYGVCEYYDVRRAVPAERFLLDRPWVR